MFNLGHRLLLLCFAVFSLATASYSQASEGVSPDMCYSFKEDGSFAGKVLVPGVSNSLVLSQKGIAEPIVARFADPVNDPLQIDSSTKAVLVDKKFIRTALKKAGVYKGLHHGLLLGSLYLTFRSNYGGVLDFARNSDYGADDNVLYITYTKKEGYVAHNKYNFGNFLWGAAAKAMGIPGFIARTGSHMNNFFLSPNNKWTLDTRDDIFSIKNGYHWK